MKTRLPSVTPSDRDHYSTQWNQRTWSKESHNGSSRWYMVKVQGDEYFLCPKKKSLSKTTVSNSWALGSSGFVSGDWNPFTVSARGVQWASTSCPSPETCRKFEPSGVWPDRSIVPVKTCRTQVDYRENLNVCLWLKITCCKSSAQHLISFSS